MYSAGEQLVIFCTSNYSRFASRVPSKNVESAEFEIYKGKKFTVKYLPNFFVEL